MLKFLLLSPEVVILQFPVLLRFLCVCVCVYVYVSSSGISLLLKKLWFTSSFGCHLSLTKRGKGKHMLRTLYMGCLEVVFCGKLSSFHQGSMSRSQRKADVKCILTE